MYKKKDIIYSGTLGVCRVEEVTGLVDRKGENIMYYGIKALQDGRTAYIPVDNHAMELRELISREEADELKQSSYDDKTSLERYEIDYVLDRR